MGIKNCVLNILCYKIIISCLIISLVFLPEIARAKSINRFYPPPSTLGSSVSENEIFVPLLLKGVSIDINNPFVFNFIVDGGNREDRSEESIRIDSEKSLKYFLSGLTIPEEDLWVNLSPYESNRIMPKGLGQTEMGRDLLMQDYLLKQLSASLIHPEGEFWEEGVYFADSESNSNKLRKLSRIWIVPDEAEVFENEGAAYVTKSRLKVMIEKDFLAMRRLKEKDLLEEVEEKRVMEDNLISRIEKEVNEGESFVRLRQIYNALILAKWYKETINNKLLESVYVDKNKVEGVNVEDKKIGNKIYEKYMDSYREGVFSYVREEYNSEKQEIIVKRYISGGAELSNFEVTRTTHKGSILSNTNSNWFQLNVKAKPFLNKGVIEEKRDENKPFAPPKSMV